ncbi:methyl-accepting chemotaxis protein [Cohnella suwonensis]|uniref:Methyl-accepting chemotaxis protein n=1 Tax=Cohnella suwonensis TaxID=696072 RepID=A0ABW0M2E5_9BACL
MKLNIGMKLVAMSLILLLGPVLVTGITSYNAAKNQLNKAGEIGLKNDVRLVIEMINALDKQVKQGRITLEEAQEQVKISILGPKREDNTRPINTKIDIGTHGYYFVMDKNGVELAHPNIEGKNLWDTKSSDGVMLGQEIIKQALNGGGYTYYAWALPGNPDKLATKITYSEADPHWGWIVAAGSYLMDFNQGANNILNRLYMIVGVAFMIGIGLIYIMARHISKPISLVTSQLQRVADGDLTLEPIQMKRRRKDEIEQLSFFTNEMTANLNEVLGNIRAASEQVAAGAKQVSESSMALSQGATEQASSVEQLTASLEEISSQTKLNADNAIQANHLAEEAKDNAVQGNERMKEMLKAMDDINDASGNISKIIKVIDEIAFQTNILALNAAVEAARAGQHGKGFAVVAEEVRNLAARSAGAAKETTDLIEGTIKKVDGGTKIAGDTAAALNKIVDGVAKVANLVSDIAVASNEQATGVAQINQGILQVSQVVQTNSATSEESAAASEELSGQAAMMQEQVGKFKLKRTARASRMPGLEAEAAAPK